MGAPIECPWTIGPAIPTMSQKAAMSSAQANRQEEADDHAFDAYIAFEPLETPARARSPGTVAALERHFADFKGFSELKRTERLPLDLPLLAS